MSDSATDLANLAQCLSEGEALATLDNASQSFAEMLWEAFNRINQNPGPPFTGFDGIDGPP